MMASKTFSNFSLNQFSYIFLVSFFLLGFCLDYARTDDINEDLVFDDVTAYDDPFSQLSLRRRTQKLESTNSINNERFKNEKSNYFSPVRFAGAIKHGYNRIKRGIGSFWFGTDDSSDENNEPSTLAPEDLNKPTESLPSTNIFTSSVREIRNTQPDEISQNQDYNDDETEDDLQYSGSGFPDRGNPTYTHEHPYLLRINLLVQEPFSSGLENKESDDFKKISQELSESLKTLYGDISGTMFAHVVKFQKPNNNDPFNSEALIDLEYVGNYNVREIKSRLKRHIEKYHRLGNITVSDKYIKMRDVTDRRGSGDNYCPDENIRCYDANNTEICLTTEARCDGISQCKDGYDENNCPTPTSIPDHTPIDSLSTNATDESTRKSTKCRGDILFSCNDGTDVCAELQCNNVNDCADGSDENDCPDDSSKTKTECKEGEFNCDVTRCLPKSNYCDGVPNCSDKTDEPPSCKDKACSTTEWQCNDGSCIDISLRCNGVRDCNTDESDELNCPVVCRDDEFRCSDGNCIAEYLRCDSYEDCPDGSDEIYCNGDNQVTSGPTECESGDFRCNNGQCISNQFHCDNIKDCSDNSDEINCSSNEIEPKTCSTNEFTCYDGSCIQYNRLCDNIKDCRDGEDELNCQREPKTCSTNEYTCYDGSCISHYRLCDNIKDCRDGEDEQNCKRDCSYYEFKCSDGTCIKKDLVCNNYSDCQNGEDEENCGDAKCLNKFKCLSNDQCIQKNLVCNQVRDCDDGSDEINCSYPPANELRLRTYPDEQIIKEGREVVFQCRDEGPLRSSVHWVRENNFPLPPNSHDHNGRLEMPNIKIAHGGVYYCEATGFHPSAQGSRKEVRLIVEPYPEHATVGPKICAYNEATCANGDCIPKNSVCDGRFDCYDRSDEKECSSTDRSSDNNGCEPNQFKCDNRRCVQQSWVCDSDDDCGDGSDERNCGTSSPGELCRPNEYKCANGLQCIPKSFHCDREVDCKDDNSDEIGCSDVRTVTLPERMKILNPGDTFTVWCVMTGVPTPVIIWRRNWGHIPTKCRTTSINGTGTITCPNVQDEDQGAYSCEGMNNHGSLIAEVDTILIVNQTTGSICPPDKFNDLAITEDDCETCFCFNRATRCHSARDLFVFHLDPPIDRFKLQNVRISSDRIIVENEMPEYQSAIRNKNNGFHLLASEIDSWRGTHPYFNMPEYYNGNQLNSYGGYLRYSVLYSGEGNYLDTPDVILIGNGITLIHRGPRPETNKENLREVRFHTGDWYIKKSPSAYYPTGEGLAVRGEIMTALANIEHLIIKVQYLSGPGIDTTITNIKMDSADKPNVGLGRANLVEECECQAGYSGRSCEECAPGYTREGTGSWGGRCVEERPIECPIGYYGDPSRNIPCERCPCPGTTAANQFGKTCRLGPNGNPVCDCPFGYEGDRCQFCAAGFVGNPTVPGDYCRREIIPVCNQEGSYTLNPDPLTGRCECKELATGAYCDQCKPNTFHLSRKHHKGCIKCFCMGITSDCRSLDWYINQITAVFSRSTQEFKLAEESDLGKPITDGLYVDSESRELVFDQPLHPEAYYWVLPSRFLGDKISSYGGYLNYTLRYVPTPGGQVSKNTAPDVIIVGLNLNLRYYNKEYPTIPNRPFTISVPLVESKWQREDGKEVNRENFLVALADLSAILIKATYTTNTQSVALSSVSLDTAEERNTNQGKTLEVEHCNCPIGYRGFSCEQCDAGYTRSDVGGFYLGICEPCNCNGHSSMCDPNTGRCLECRDHTTGENCELCLPEYEGNPLRNEPCVYNGASEVCLCDERGSASNECYNGQCICKMNIEGPRCDRCRSGTFDLSASHPEGCIECYCSSAAVDNLCQSSNLYLTQIPMQIISEHNHGFSLTDGNRIEHINENIKLYVPENKIGYDIKGQHSRTLFWSLPSDFTGNKVNSYGGNLTFTQYFTAKRDGIPLSGTDVVIFGNGLSIFWTSNDRLDANTPKTRIVPLVPSGWRRLDVINGQQPASRADIMKVLSNVEAILIRASHNSLTESTYLSDVSLDTAVSQRTGQPQATHIEVCKCLPGYTGNSCESCSPGYYKDYEGHCYKCPCNNNEERCALGLNQRVECYCKPSFTGPYCESLDNITTERPPIPYPTPTHPTTSISISITDPYVVAIVGSTVHLKCIGRSINSQLPIKFGWSKDGGELPRGRYSVEKGDLIITSVRPSDSGDYICVASDGYNYVTDRATVNVPNRPTDIVAVVPEVTVYPSYRDVIEGQSAEFTCTAIGTPTPNLSWLNARTGQLNPKARFVDGRFFIPSVDMSDQGEYKCVGTNDAGSDYKTVLLYVREPLRPVQPDRDIVRVEPSEFIGSPGSVVKINCIPPSSDDYHINWSRGNQPLQQSARNYDGVLTIYNPTESDSGVYICTCVTSGGQQYESEARVTIENPGSSPTAKIEPESQTIEQGSTVKLVCHVKGEPRPLVHWSKIPEPVLPPNVIISHNVLTINNAAVSDRGLYQCFANNSAGNSYSFAKVIVEPREPPQVQLYQSSNNVIEGGSVIFQCRYTAGTPVPTIRWIRQDGSPLPYNSEQSNYGTLKISNVTRYDGGDYICIVENSAGKITATAPLEVYTMPVIHVYPSRTIKPKRGDRVEMECRATGIPEPAVTLNKHSPYGLHGLSEHGGYGGDYIKEMAKFVITSVSERDEGFYICTATNNAGTTEEQIELTLSNDTPNGGETNYDPYDNNSPLYVDQSHYTVSLGGDVQLRCFSKENNGNIVLDWIKEGEPLSNDSVSYDGTLYIKNSKLHDSGIYSCVGISRHNGATLFSARAKLTVGEIPRIVLEPLKQVVPVGGSTRITCTAYGDQPIDIHWKAVNRSLPASVTTYQGTLTFNSITKYDAGRYLCIAQNRFGTTEGSAEVTVSDQVHNPRPVVTEADRNQRAVEGQRVLIRCDSDLNTRIKWNKENSQLPTNSRIIGNDLQIDSIRKSDAGRYICRGESSSGLTYSEYIILTVDERFCKYYEFHCDSGECIPREYQCDNISQCSDSSDEYDCSQRLLRGANNITLKIKPSRDVIHVDDDLELKCISYGGHSQSTVEWTRFGNAVSSNVGVYGDTIIISKVKPQNEGLYRCSSITPSGRVDEDYILNIRDLPISQEPIEIKTAALGQTVVMNCDVKMPQPVTYRWSRQDGDLPRHASINQGILSIPEVTAADAGMYICTASNNEERMDIPTILTVTGSIPFFTQAPNSFIALPTLQNAYNSFDIEISFKPEHPDGLILYNGQKQSDSGDFVSFGLRNGIPEFRFDVGSGMAVINSSRPIQIGEWHTVKLQRNHKRGKMFVDGEGPYSGETFGKFQGLDLLEPLYIGGYSDFSKLNKMADFSFGFVGCISRLMIGNEEVDLMKHAIQREEITQCETCAVNPCQNNGACQESPTANGFTCICPRGFTGEKCSVSREPCYPGICGTGKCQSAENRIECMCPLNKGGKRCERDIYVYEPALSGDGYLAYPTPKPLHKLKIALRANPTTLSDSILLYSAQNKNGQGDFVSINIKDRRVEFRFDSPSGPVIIRSKDELRPGIPFIISAVREHKDGQIHSKLIVNGEPPVTETTYGKVLNLRTLLYIGGYDKHQVRIAPGVGVRDNFYGCISEVEISGLKIDLLRSIVESANVEDCSEMQSDACQSNPCRNEGTCEHSLVSPYYTCLCKPGFSGSQCESEDICKVLNPCQNDGKCIGTSSSYKCDCPLGYAGPNCENRVEFTTEVSFEGNGFVELDKYLLPHTNSDEDEVITIEFSTKNHNGIILWQGQNPEEDGTDRDYLALAVNGGYLEMAWELGDGPGIVRSKQRVDDGNKHIAVIKRNGKEGNLKVDGEVRVFGETPGITSTLNTVGNIYIGGVPDAQKMTGRKYLEGFNGCIHFVQIQNSGVINLWEMAISAQNALPCKSSDNGDENSITPGRGDTPSI